MRLVMCCIAVMLTASFATPTAFAEEPVMLTAFEQECQALAADATLGAGDKLNRLLQLKWDYDMKESPESATYEGIPGNNDKWTDMSAAAIAHREREAGAPLTVLKAIQRAQLGKQEQLTYDLFQSDVEADVYSQRFNGKYMPLNQMGGVQQDIAQTIEVMPHEHLKDFENIIARIRGSAAVIEQIQALLAKGLETGITPPKITLRDVPQQVRNQITPEYLENPLQSPILMHFREMPEAIPAAEQERLRKAAADAFLKNTVPAYQTLLEYLEKTYIPGCRESIGMRDLPNGEDWYAFRVRRSTTTRLTPKEIHEIGLKEVKRIRGEMDALIGKIGFAGTFAEFCEFLRTDKRFFCQTPEELLTRYRDISKRVDPELIRLFGKLPRMPYGVVPVPDYAAKSQTTAYYMPGSDEARRPGYFYANTYNLASRPTWEMEALTLHEAVPGHHLQIALAKEIEELPRFRKNLWLTAYGEGWALYAERLGLEMGFYQDPYSDFGRLTYEMWRAIRLVVDTGMHSMGWTREQAIQFFRENSSKSEHDITVEVDRYIVWPGQALAYKIGELKIRELRAFAEKELGAAFDIRAFHDEVLAYGCLPLDILERQVKDWVAARKAK